MKKAVWSKVFSVVLVITVFLGVAPNVVFAENPNTLAIGNDGSLSSWAEADVSSAIGKPFPAKTSTFADNGVISDWAIDAVG